MVDWQVLQKGEESLGPVLSGTGGEGLFNDVQQGDQLGVIVLESRNIKDRFLCLFKQINKRWQVSYSFAMMRNFR